MPTGVKRVTSTRSKAKRGTLKLLAESRVGRKEAQRELLPKIDGCSRQNGAYRFTQYVTRGGAVAARQAHNLKVEGSNPSPATKFARNF